MAATKRPSLVDHCCPRCHPRSSQPRAGAGAHVGIRVAWKGPLSTTITTDHTFTDSVPDLTGRTLRVMAHLTMGGSQCGCDSASVLATSLVLALSRRDPQQRQDIASGTDRSLTLRALVGDRSAGSDLWSDSVTLTVSAGRIWLSPCTCPAPLFRRPRGARAGQDAYHSGQPGFRDVSDGASTTRKYLRCTRCRFSRPVQGGYRRARRLDHRRACSAVDADGDWPDRLAHGCRRCGRNCRGVLNAGIGRGAWLPPMAQVFVACRASMNC